MKNAQPENFQNPKNPPNKSAKNTEKIDFKKQQKELYTPGAKPALVRVPEMGFIAVDGSGPPEGECYQNAVGVLYSLTYTIKMSKMNGPTPPGYVEYSVPPLEGLWANVDFGGGNRENWAWTSLIRQPDFVDEDVMRWAIAQARQKKPGIDFSAAYYLRFEEGLCAQLMHHGPYADELPSMERLAEFIAQNGLAEDYGPKRRHHEIYLNTPQRTAPEKLRTVLRTPVRELQV